MGWYRGEVPSKVGFCGKDNSFLKVARSLSSKVLSLVCPFTPYHYKGWPRMARLRQERIERDFLWSKETLYKKSHLIEWSNVCSEKDKRLGR